MSAAPPAAAEGAPRRPGPRARLLAALWSGSLRLLAASWSVRIDGLAALDADLAARRPLLAAFWHGTYLPLFALLRGRGVVIFTSASARGDVLAELCRRFGHRAAQIADHGRESSLERMREALAGETAGAVVVDGPLGPRHVVKRGVVRLAADQGRVIYPIAVAASRRWVFAERWDRREVPYPASRVRVEIGSPLAVPAGLAAESEAAWCERVQRALEALDRRAADAVAGRQPPAARADG